MKTNYIPSLTEIGIAATRSMGRPLAALTKEQREVQEELSSECRGLDRLGVILPFREHRDMTATGTTSTTGDQGGMTIANEVPEIGLSLRQGNPLTRLGARMITGLQGDATMPAGTAQVNAAWKAEGAAADEESEVFAAAVMAPKRICAFLEVSQQLLIQSQGFEAWLRAELFAALGEEIAAAGIQGATDGPTGLLNTTGVQILTGDTNGSTASMADLCEMEFNVTNLRSEGSFGFLSSPTVRRKLRQTVRIASTDSATILDDRAGNRLLGYNTEFTKASPDDLTKGTGTDLSAIIFGDWREMFVGFWGNGISVEALPVFNTNEGKVLFLVYAYVDVVVRIPKAFSARNDIITTLS